MSLDLILVLLGIFLSGGLWKVNGTLWPSRSDHDQRMRLLSNRLGWVILIGFVSSPFWIPRTTVKTALRWGTTEARAYVLIRPSGTQRPFQRVPALIHSEADEHGRYYWIWEADFGMGRTLKFEDAEVTLEMKSYVVDAVGRNWEVELTNDLIRKK